MLLREKNIKIILKQAFLLIIVILISFKPILRAETLNSVPKCNGQQCLSNVSDVMIANSGDFFLLVNSGTNSYVRKIKFSSNMIDTDVLISINESNTDGAAFKINISNDSKKALMYKETKILAKSNRVSNNYEQVGQGTSCLCSSSGSFNGTTCVAETLSCTGVAEDIVCGCNNLNYLNSCTAQANGVKKFTKAPCGTTSNLSCSNNSQCPSATCSNKTQFNRFTCISGMCVVTEFSVDPCISSSSSSSSSSGATGSLIHILDLQNNTVKSITPYLVQEKSNVVSKVTNNEGINVANFLDKGGNEILASNNNADSPELYIIDSNTGEITQNIEIPDIANSIEFSPDFEKAVITFKSLFIQSIGIYNVGLKKITKIDIPEDIFFDVGVFLSNVSFDLKSQKSVISSLGGQHVLYFLNLDKNELIVRFLSDNDEGKTCSAISPDGNTVISASELRGKNQIVIYKVNGSNLKKLNIIKTAKIKSNGNLLDVRITPDGNNIFLLVLNDDGLKLKVVAVKDLSELCEYNVSNTFHDSFLAVNPNGQFLVIPELQGENLNLITDLNLGPVFRSVNPSTASRKEGTQFTIDGFVDDERFKEDFKICFDSERFCAKSISISDNGRSISGITPVVPFKGKSDLLLIGKNKKEESDVSSSSGSTHCKQSNYTRSKYKNVFVFE